jgi:hypothetical protein
LVVVSGCQIERAANKFGSDGLYGVVHRDPQDVSGAEGGEQKEHREPANRTANPELLWPQASAELCSAWTGEGARPHTSAVQQH